MDFVLIGIFELLMLALILQSIVICWLAFRPRKPDEKWIIKREVKSEPQEDDVPDTDGITTNTSTSSTEDAEPLQLLCDLEIGYRQFGT